MNRYFTYCRKSTDDQDHQILSIESQRTELKRYAEREHLIIVAVKEEAKSAKSPGRPVFNDLLERIERGEADGILAWHPDRLARNSLDGGRVIHFLDTGKIVSLRFPTYTFENTPQGKFMLAIMFGQSKYQVDSLSENVRRGNRTKREKGWLPGRAPTGYLNVRSEAGEKIIASDPTRFPLVKRIWELLLSGGFSVAQIHELAERELALRTPQRKRRGGSPMSLSGVYRVFTNPFYAGQIAHEGHWYAGKHEPVITVAQFERAQELLGRTTAPRPKSHTFAYTGLILCGTCQASITAEKKINRHGSRYVYYHCTHHKRGVSCDEKSIEEVQLQKQIAAFLKGIHIDAEETKQALAIIEEERKTEQRTGAGVKESIERALETSLRNSDNLTTLRYRELIGDDEFLRQRKVLMQEQAGLKQRLQQLHGEQWIEPSRRLFLFSNRAIFWLAHGSTNEKRLIVATVGSNPTLSHKKLNIHARNPFLALQQSDSIRNWSAIVNDVRTFFRANPEYEVPLLPEIDHDVTLAAYERGCAPLSLDDE